MDHVWDGFYTGQIRLSRFPIQMQTDEDYTLYSSGTPPGKMRYTLRAAGGGTKIRLYYPNAGAYNVYANGQFKEMTDWDRSLGRPGPLNKNKGCGENRFVGVENFIEFYLTTNCEIRVEPLDQIFTKVRLSWTIEEFYADGGTTTFTDRVAGALGVDSWRIKTVAVYEGSVIVEFFLVADESLEEDSIAELRKKGELLSRKLADTDAPWLGAPIISVISNGETIVDDSLFFDGNSGTATLIDEFLADRDGTDDDGNIVVVITPVIDEDPSDVLPVNPNPNPNTDITIDYGVVEEVAVPSDKDDDDDDNETADTDDQTEEEKA